MARAAPIRPPITIEHARPRVAERSNVVWLIALLVVAAATLDWFALR